MMIKRVLAEVMVAMSLLASGCCQQVLRVDCSDTLSDKELNVDLNLDEVGADGCNRKLKTKVHFGPSPGGKEVEKKPESKVLPPGRGLKYYA